MTYKILPYFPYVGYGASRVIGVDERSSYNVYDFFDGAALDAEYTSLEAAEQAAKNAYRGPDIDGLEVTWDIVEQAGRQ